MDNPLGRMTGCYKVSTPSFLLDGLTDGWLPSLKKGPDTFVSPVGSSGKADVSTGAGVTGAGVAGVVSAWAAAARVA